uniref:Uncharacterized protein n=1 Tax=mine drainage metagenome TaxID=410659 RepID=E6QWM2_9ZZZZ
MAHVLYTHCDAGKGDTLIDHWLRSAKLHVDLTDIEIVVIDFGLTETQRAQLRNEGVTLWPARADGRTPNIQYREIAAYLATRPDIDQVVYSDCGDLVFQADITPILKYEKTKMKAVVEPEFNLALHGITLGFGDVRPEWLAEIRKMLGERPTANCGFVVGPREKMASVWATYRTFCHGVALHGTDQLIINYILRRDGFVELERIWNYVTFLNGERFYYDSDRFLCNREGRIPVVHNAGRYDSVRTITGFGYRCGRIRPRAFSESIRLFYRSLNWLHGVFRNRATDDRCRPA